ncbi:hypothetical protein ACMXYO_15435 [Neptuniibacter sp. QD37_6]|uniref:hypothetical protein n=1 Tax=Neptuniibacter sp. QD37_6 TaxID=3398210 RepID=UPI0039F4F1D0
MDVITSIKAVPTEFWLVAGLILFIGLMFERVRRFIYQTLFRKYFLKCFFFPIFNNRLFQVMIPGLAASYFICLDVWGDDWPILADHKEFHSLAFSIMIGLSIFSMLTRALFDIFQDKSDKDYIRFLEDFCLLTSRVVITKLNRFKGKASSLSPSGDTFKKITHPSDQINHIINEIEHFLNSAYGISQQHLRITVLHEDHRTKRWTYKFLTNQNWNYTKAETLITGNSTAKQCLDTGEPRFYPDKIEASNKRNYMMSDRDNRYGNGSIFCYPVFIENADYTDRYIISIVTYGPMLCDPLDDRLVEATNVVFCDICKRLELELTLLSIKNWQFNFHTNRTRKAS